MAKSDPKDHSAAMAKYIAKIDQFATMLREQQDSIKRLVTIMDDAKRHFDEAKDAVREAKDYEHETVALLLKFIRPGSIDIMPLFDRMEPTEKKHGVGADEWRKEPLTSLNLSALAMRALIAADVVLVGQLQDRILTGGEWWNGLEGITDAIAQAIESKLHDFIQEKQK